jgi:hypothetical protein
MAITRNLAQMLWPRLAEETTFFFDEEFVSSNASGTVLPGPGGSAGDNIGLYHWDVMNDDDGPFRGLASEPAHPGIVQIESTTAVNMRVSGSRTSGGQQMPTFDMSELVFLQCIFRIPTTSSFTNCSYGIGLTSSAADADVSGTTPLMGGTALVMHKPTSNANWLARRVTAGVASGFDSGRVAVLSDWIHAHLHNQGGGTWSLRLNGAMVASVTGVATSGLVAPLFWMSSTTALTRRLDVDKFSVGVLLGQRYTT